MKILDAVGPMTRAQMKSGSDQVDFEKSAINNKQVSVSRLVCIKKDMVRGLIKPTGRTLHSCITEDGLFRWIWTIKNVTKRQKIIEGNESRLSFLVSPNKGGTTD